jgi:hypothetical protein
MRALIAFGLGLLVVVGSVLSLELWCESNMDKKKPLIRDMSKILKVDQLKKMYPMGIYPSPPPPIPPEKSYKGPRFLKMKTNGEFIYLNDPNVHPLSHRLVISQPDGKVLSDVEYRFDKFNRRMYPINEAKKNAKKFVAYFGDSNIIGFGLPLEQTLSHLVSERMPDTRIYDYSAIGVHPYEILDRTQEINPSVEIAPKDGVALYFYFSYHILRNMGSVRELAQKNRANKQMVMLDSKGDIFLGGTFKDERPIWFWLAPYLSNSAIVRYFNLELVPKDYDYRLQTAIIKRMQKNLSDKGINKFYVVIHPMQFEIEQTQTLLSYLDKEKIPFIYMGHWKMGQITDGPVTLVYDFHMSGQANKVIADGLEQALSQALNEVAKQ